MDLEIWYDPNGDWAALYVDGKLEKVGDAVNVDEYALHYAGVTTVQDNAFLRGGNGRQSVAPTLAEVKTYAAKQEEKRLTAETLRKQAQELLDQAEELEK